MECGCGALMFWYKNELAPPAGRVTETPHTLQFCESRSQDWGLVMYMKDTVLSASSPTVQLTLTWIKKKKKSLQGDRQNPNLEENKNNN